MSTATPIPGSALRVLVLGCLLALIATAPSPAREEPLRIDRSSGSTSGLVWLVASSPGAETADPFVAVAIGRLADAPVEQVFALGQDGGGSSAPGAANRELVPSELLAPDRTAIVITVGPRAHDEIRHLVARWVEGEQAEAEPSVRVENLLERVARAIGLETPYRSVLRGSDPVAYVRDLARLNAER
jgi:hypothetical protein